MELPEQVLAMREIGSDEFRDHIQPTLIVREDSDESDVIAVFWENPQRSVAVLGEGGSSIAVINAGDLLCVIEEVILVRRLVCRELLDRRRERLCRGGSTFGEFFHHSRFDFRSNPGR